MDVLFALDNRDVRAPVLATEFTGTSLTSESGPWAEPFLPLNSHVRFHD